MSHFLFIVRNCCCTIAGLSFLKFPDSHCWCQRRNRWSSGCLLLVISACPCINSCSDIHLSASDGNSSGGVFNLLVLVAIHSRNVCCHRSGRSCVVGSHRRIYCRHGSDLCF